MVFVTPRFLSHLLYSPCTPHGVQTHKNIDKPRFYLYSHCEYKICEYPVSTASPTLLSAAIHQQKAGTASPFVLLVPPPF